MLYWTDLHLECDVDDGRIAQAIAMAFGVPEVAVAVVEVSEAGASAWDRQGLQVFVQRDDLDRSGHEFPVTLMVTLRQDARIDQPIEKVRALGEKLGIAMITDVETEGDEWRLVMPDGEDRLVHVEPEGDRRGELKLTPEDRAALESHRPIIV